MQSFVKFLSIFIIAYTAFQGNRQVHAEDIYFFRISDKKIIALEQTIKDLKTANLIFLGEIHGYESVHRFQLDIIKGLNSLKVPLAIGLEMFTDENQEILDRWTRGAFPVTGFIKSYYKTWKVPWTFYNDIFVYMRDNKIPAIGLNVSREISQKIVRKGFASLSPNELKVFPPGVTCSVDRKYMDFIRRVYAEHRHGNSQFVYFCEAQLLKDKAMAWRLAEFLRKNPERTVIVLTGSSHAWKKGIPKEVEKLIKGLSYRVILPQIPKSIEPTNVTSEDADYILLRH